MSDFDGAPVWVDLALNKLIDQLEPVLVVFRGLLEVLLAGLEPIQSILDDIAIFLEELDPSIFDFTLGFNLLGAIEILHHYPYQEYQALRLPVWARAVENSFSTSYVNDYPPPYQMIVITVSANTIALLMELVDLTQDIFKQGRSFTDDLPKVLDRDLFHIRTAKSYQVKDVVPVLGDFAEYLSSSITISGSGPVRTLRDAILFKVRAINFKLDRIIQIVEDLKALQSLPQMKKTAFTVNTVNEIAAKIQIATGGPTSDDFVAGSAIFANVPTMEATNLLLLEADVT